MDMIKFKPVKVTHISDKVYEGTKVPKLTDAQVTYAQKAYATFLRKLAAHGMKFDYYYAGGGFYVRDFRLDWNFNDDHDGEATEQSKEIVTDIIKDGFVDIGDSDGYQQLPLFIQENDGFHVLEHLLDAKVSDNCSTMPY